jgi:DNA-binding NarL/FixJ family response regulator
MTTQPKALIALVDDRPANRYFFSDKLKALPGVELLFCASDGEEFLETMAGISQLPDLVFMDIDMPGLNGIETVWRASSLYPQTRFVMLTVFEDDDKIFQAVKAGAVGYLLKEDNSIHLQDIVEEVLHFGGSPMSPAVARKALKLLAAAPPPSKPEEDHSLSEREMDILQCLVEGKEYKQISEQLYISPNTVRTHIYNIYRKLHVNNKAQAIRLAERKSWFR